MTQPVTQPLACLNSPGAHRARIMIVEDQRVVARDLRMALVELGYDVVAMAASGTEAVAQAAASHPDLILMDVRMPGAIDGIDAATAIHAGQRVPVIFLTAHSDAETVARARAAEPFGYLLKPFKQNELMCSIEIALERNQLETDLRRSAEEKVHALEVELEERVASVEGRFRTLIENASDAVWMVTPEGVIADCNRRAEEIHGRPRDQIIGAHITATTPPSAVERVAANFGRTFDEGFVRVTDIPIQRPDGTARLVDISSCLLDMDGRALVMALGHDVTDERRLEEQNRQLQKLEAVGQLTGGVAHDFNNILGAIIAFVHLLLESLGEDDPRREDVLEVRGAAERGAALTRQLLAFSRKQVLEPSSLDLGAVVGGIEKMLRRVIGEDVELTVKKQAGLGAVLADRGQIEQVLMNLVVNARDAMPSGGRLVIETCNVELDEAYATGHIPMAPGPYVMLSVSDTGCGMDAETRARALEPFFTTKERGRGTGLGLSTVYGIIKQSGGYLWLYSEVGRGTVFKIYLPRHDAPPAAEVVRGDRPDAARGETIFLLEDDPAIRGAVTRILTTEGYQVVSAVDARDAQAVAARHAGPVHVILSDVIVPGGTGPECVETLAARFPGAKVLFMSGYTDHALFREGAALQGLQFLQKPFAPRALLQKVRDLLDGGAL